MPADPPELARSIIDESEVWLVLAMSTHTNIQGIKNCIGTHDRIRDFLGKPRVDWMPMLRAKQKMLGEPEDV